MKTIIDAVIQQRSWNILKCITVYEFLGSHSLWALAFKSIAFVSVFFVFLWLTWALKAMSAFLPSVPCIPLCNPYGPYFFLKGFLCCSVWCNECTHVCVRTCVFLFVWRVTPSISRALEKVTLLESSLHLGLPCPWILWGFFLLLLEAKTKWDDIYYICLTADRLVLTHPPHKLMHGAFVVSLLVTFKPNKKNKKTKKQRVWLVWIHATLYNGK